MLDRDELADLPPEDVAAYLAAHGWQRDASQGPSEIWSLTAAGAEFDVHLPNNAELRDYPARVAEVLAALAEVETRPREEILRDLQNPRIDVQHIRLLPDAPSGTIPLHGGFLAIRGVHDLYLAAATSAVLRTTPPVLPAQRPAEAWRFVRTVRLGQTGAGSYVLRVETPLEGSSRDVLAHLYRAIRTAHSTAGVGTVFDFARHTGAGVTANLCKALADIGGTHRNPFEFSFTWAPAVPFEADTPALRFDGRRIARLRDASDHLRTLPASEEGGVRQRGTEGQ